MKAVYTTVAEGSNFRSKMDLCFLVTALVPIYLSKHIHSALLLLCLFVEKPAWILCIYEC